MSASMRVCHSVLFLTNLALFFASLPFGDTLSLVLPSWHRTISEFMCVCHPFVGLASLALHVLPTWHCMMHASNVRLGPCRLSYVSHPVPSYQPVTCLANLALYNACILRRFATLLLVSCLPLYHLLYRSKAIATTIFCRVSEGILVVCNRMAYFSTSSARSLSAYSVPSAHAYVIGFYASQ